MFEKKQFVILAFVGALNSGDFEAAKARASTLSIDDQLEVVDAALAARRRLRGAR